MSILFRNFAAKLINTPTIMADNDISIYNPKDESVVIYRSEDATVTLDVQLADETVWLTQKQMAWLFDRTPQNITIHLGNVYKEKELTREATCKDFLQVQQEGGRSVQRWTKFYNLDVIISVGYRVKSQRGTQFRQWATRVLKDYLLKGYVVNQRPVRAYRCAAVHPLSRPFPLHRRRRLSPRRLPQGPGQKVVRLQQNGDCD